MCPKCGSSTWRMQRRYYVNWVANDLTAIMVCRNCKHKVFFGTEIEKDPEEEDEDEEEEDEGLFFDPFGFGGRRRRKPKLDFETRFRLMAHYR